jgi:hypothetical protein
MVGAENSPVATNPCFATMDLEASFPRAQHQNECPRPFGEFLPSRGTIDTISNLVHLRLW